MTGVVTFKNPYGYLPGYDLGSLPFFWALSIAFTFVILVYLVLLIRFRRNLQPLQIAIVVVLFVSLIEAYVRAADYTYTNNTGNLCMHTRWLSD